MNEALDIAGIRQRLNNADGPTYWRSLEELAGSPEFTAFLHDEFPRLAPLWEQAIDRRSMLKLMAAGMALAGLTACGRRPAEEIVPYVNMPEHQVPGLPRHYATTALVGGYGHGVIAETHEGRPTKLEGNPDHPATRGALDAWSQASVLSLYDPDRSQTVRRHGELATFGGLLAALEEKRGQWDRTGGRGLHLLSDTVTSPSVAAAIETLRERWPRMRWFVHEPAGRDNVWTGAELAFGRRLEPRYHFDTARVVCALDADFMAGEPGFLRHARDFMARRRPDPETPSMSRLYAVESVPGITGSVADHRRPLAADRIEAVARHLARMLGLAVAAPGEPPVPGHWLAALAEDLRANRGAALVVAGAGQPAAVHAICHAINEALGALGRTVVLQPPVAASHAAEDLASLAGAIDAGDVDTLAVLGANPVYSAPADLAFAGRFRKVPLRLHWGEYTDETARLSHWHVPAAHALETWGDARAYDGTVSLIQPLIQPLHGGRTALQFLRALTTGAEEGARDLLQRHWRGRAGFESDWRRWLRDGLVPGTTAEVVNAPLRDDWTTGLPAPRRGGETLTLQLYPDAAVYDGRYANNGWLQELPRPLSKITWGNAALIAPALAASRGLAEGDVVRLEAGGRQLTLPVYILPGHPPDAVSISLGHGRTAAGRVGNGVGANACALRTSADPWFASGLRLQKTGERRPLATTQNHHAMEGRDLIRAADLETFRNRPDFARSDSPHESLYPEPRPSADRAGRQWGMSIDLTACIGCNACVTACQAENNIPVVGESEVARGRDMHWIRIDRYFEGQPEQPRMVFQPVTCMHCDNAPCEYVCPVAATQQSSDGLNEMIYNRCVGTRYCSQNCPYKVRRFNWVDYAGGDAGYPVDPAVANPDVTVRSRGVMEKCTYCVQRIRRAEIEAGAADLPLGDGDVVTACQQACPTGAIVFGDIEDPGSAVSRAKRSPLSYGLLENLNTRPRTTYLAAIHNPNPRMTARPGEEVDGERAYAAADGRGTGNHDSASGPRRRRGGESA